MKPNHLSELRAHLGAMQEILNEHVAAGAGRTIETMDATVDLDATIQKALKLLTGPLAQQELPT